MLKLVMSIVQSVLNRFLQKLVYCDRRKKGYKLVTKIPASLDGYPCSSLRDIFIDRTFFPTMKSFHLIMSACGSALSSPIEMSQPSRKLSIKLAKLQL